MVTVAKAPSSPTRVHNDSLIQESWQRAVSTGITQDRLDITNVPSDQLDKNEFTEAAMKVINATASALDDTNTWISYANAEGAITYQWSGNDKFKKQLDKINVVEGALLSEQSVGPSGISIALASNQQVIVTGEQHYKEAWKSLVCAASPVVNPLTNNVVGAVNITCLAKEQNAHIKIALKTVVNGFQQILASGMRSQQRSLLDAHLKTKHIAKAPVLTIDSSTMIDERELEHLNLTHKAIREFVQSQRHDVRQTKLPNGCRVTIVRHGNAELDPSFSLVFNVDDLEENRIRILEGETKSDFETGGLRLLEKAERDTILATLIKVEGNKSLAADLLGVSRGTLYERINKYSLQQYI